LSLSSVKIPVHFRVFNFIVYHGYSNQALKGYKGETVPSIGILDKFYCPIHKRVEYLYGTDVDHKITPPDIDNCIVTETKYGNHIICNAHITDMSTAYEYDELFTKKFGGDMMWHEMAKKQGYHVWRIYGKYADYPFVKVIKPSSDYILSLLQQLYKVEA